MDELIINGLILTSLKQIFHPKGDVFHVMKKSDVGFKNFGEAYFSTIKKNEIKPWKLHTKMTLNLIVPVGSIRFVIYDDRNNSPSFRKFSEIILSLDNYKRLTVPPNIWMAFQGLGKGLNLLLNIANIEHDPQEIERMELDKIKYEW